MSGEPESLPPMAYMHEIEHDARLLAWTMSDSWCAGLLRRATEIAQAARRTITTVDDVRAAFEERTPPTPERTLPNGP